MIDLEVLAPKGSSERELLDEIDLTKLPRHIAIIMDGNGRWAKQRGSPRVEGHRAGIASVRESVETCARLELDALTLYAFSVENWKRPRFEIVTLMSLLKEYLTKELGNLLKNDIRFRVVGRVLPGQWAGLRTTSASSARRPTVREFRVPSGSHPHDVAPAPDGTVWYTAQLAGALGRLDPGTGKTTHIPLGDGSAPHGVIVGPDGAPLITDGGLNAIVRVDPESLEVKRFPLPPSSGYANLNTATFDRAGCAGCPGPTA